MNMLYSAAVSHCLESSQSPDTVLKFDDVAKYVRPTDRYCPDGETPYASFSVLQGPVCPHGHQFAPREARPLKTTTANAKVASLYAAFGFTNLIVNEIPHP